MPSRCCPRFGADEGEDGYNAIHAHRVPAPGASGPGGRVLKQTSYDELCVSTHVMMMKDHPRLPLQAQSPPRPLDLMSSQSRPASQNELESDVNGQTAEGDGYNTIHVLRVPTPGASGPGGGVHKHTAYDKSVLTLDMMMSDCPPLPPKAQNFSTDFGRRVDMDGLPTRGLSVRPPRPPKPPTGNDWAVGCADRALSERMVLSRHESVGANFVVRFSPRIAAKGPILSMFEPTSRTMYHLPVVRDAATKNYSIGGFQFGVPCHTLVALIDHLLALSTKGYFVARGAKLRLFKGTVAAVTADTANEGGSGGSGGGSNGPKTIAAVARDAVATSSSATHSASFGPALATTSSDAAANAKSGSAAPALANRPRRKTFKRLIRSQLQPQRSAASSADPFSATFDYDDLADEAVQETLLTILLRKKRRRMAQQFQRWLEEQIVPCSMDDKAASITHLLRHVNEVVRSEPVASGSTARPGSNPELPTATAGEIAVCFCGNPALAQVLQNSVDATGYQMEFATDSHAA